MDNQQLKKINDELVITFLDAGKKSIDLRDKGLKTEIKSDNTPVTNGDIEVNKIITEKIKNLTPDIPIVSEESSLNKSREDLSKFWLIDPIDGTYDYINNRDEFTLNAALIIDKKPDIVVLIDSPDFNHRVAKRLKKKSFRSPVICYVAPSAWAWRENRVKSMTCLLYTSPSPRDRG